MVDRLVEAYRAQKRRVAVVLVAAYVILFLPLAVGYQRVGLEASRQLYDDVAASLGSRPARTFARVTLPLALPGFVAGAILVGLLLDAGRSG